MAYFYNPETGQKGEYDPAQFPGGLPAPYQEITMTPEEYAAYLASLGVKPTAEQPAGQPSAADLTRIRTTYFDDLRNRGGDWVTLANYFWTQTASMTGVSDIDTLYRKLFDQGVAGNFNVAGVSAPTPGQAGWPTGEFAASFPQAAWEKAFGLPSFGQNPFQQWLASQAAPSYAGWLGRELLPQTTMPSTFESFLSQGGREQAGATGLGALRQAKGLLPEEQGQWLSELAGPEAGIASLSALMRAALGVGGRGFATPVANIMAQRLGGLQGAWLKETGAGATGPTFLEYLMKTYGLS